MRAVLVRELGGPEVLGVEEVPDPRPAAGEVLVRLRAAGVNPVETYIRAGRFGRSPSLPYVPGGDGAGDVVSVGEGVTAWREGDRVYVAGPPTYAEMVAAKADTVWPLPAPLTYEQGAAVGIPYRTAHFALHAVGGARPGDRVLVHGASGGVGVAAVQVAVAHGCTAVGTAGTDAGRQLVRLQGAVAAVPHGDAEAAVGAAGGPFDVIVEMLANANLDTDLKMLAAGGRVVVVGSRGRVEIDPRDLMARSASVVGVLRVGEEERRRIHLALDAGLRHGVLRPVVGRRFPLDDAPAAHAAVMEPGAMGKIVLTIE